jgi:hypothetical protein
MPLKPGSILIFSNKKKDILSIGQKLFTHEWIEHVSPKKFNRGDKTHTAIAWFPQAGQDSVLEAYLCTTIDPFSQHTKDTKYWVFEPIGFTDAQIEEALNETYLKYAASDYGFMEIPWFIYRFYVEAILHKDIRKQHNWFPGGNICSQLAWNYLYALGKYKPGLRIHLDEWRSTTFHSSDSYTIVTSWPNLFTLKQQQL